MEIGCTGSIPYLYFGRNVRFGGGDAFGYEEGAEGGRTGVFAVVSLGESGDEGGFTNVGISEDYHLYIVCCYCYNNLILCAHECLR